MKVNIFFVFVLLEFSNIYPDVIDGCVGYDGKNPDCPNPELKDLPGHGGQLFQSYEKTPYANIYSMETIYVMKTHIRAWWRM